MIVGAGPAGLSAAIRLGQFSQQRSLPLSIAVIEKGLISVLIFWPVQSRTQRTE